MTIDEVIAHTREVAAMNKERAEQIRKLTVYHDIDYAAEHKKEAEYNIQIADWLEELKSIKENSISKEAFEKMKSKAYKKGHRQGYNNAIDDFVKKAKELKHEDGELSDIDLDYIAGFLRMESEEHGKNI